MNTLTRRRHSRARRRGQRALLLVLHFVPLFDELLHGRGGLEGGIGGVHCVVRVRQQGSKASVRLDLETIVGLARPAPFGTAAARSVVVAVFILRMHGR